jgi:hypothetical protein
MATEEGLNTRLTLEEETRIVALLARGDTYKQIQAHMISDLDRSVTEMTISAVKKRNASNLELIKNKFLEKQENDARALKDEANKIIGKRLKREDKATQIRAKAQDQYINGEITLKEYTEILRTNKEVSIGELVSVSKEMHNQSVDDSDKDTSKNDTSALIEAIKSGDEVKLQQIIFNAKT